MRTNDKLDLASIRARLQHTDGKQYWRSLEELAGTEEFAEFLNHEFPALASSPPSGLSRRSMLRVMGASLALAGLTACTRAPEEKIVPYVRAPEDFVPGRPLFYATAMTLGGLAAGLLVETHLGRPTKVEGNPQHPASLGATDAYSQASVLTLYDPDRSRTIMHNGRIASGVSLLASLNTERDSQLAKRGAGLRILTETVTSPTLAAQLQALLAEFPEARWHQYEPAGADFRHGGARMAFGRPANPLYNLERADIILAIDSDFLSGGPGHLSYARRWAARRQPGAGPMNRLYAIETSPCNTGAVADHRFPVRPRDLDRVVTRLARAVGVQVEGPAADGDVPPWVQAVARDLQTNRGACVVVAGEYQSPYVQALAHAMNFELGNVNRTVVYTAPVEANPVDQRESLSALVRDMKSGTVDFLLILGGNPVFNAPADFDFAGSLMKVRQRAHLSMYLDETSRLCHWHIPESHYLEAWGDARAFDGTVSIVQPVIAPMYESRSAHELVSAFLGTPDLSGHEAVRQYWMGKHGPAGFDEAWSRWLHDGVVPETALPVIQLSLARGWRRAGQDLADGDGSGSGVDVVFRPDPAVFDGRFANNGWLQELPKPLTKLTWDNAILMSPSTAERLGVQYRDMVEVKYRGAAVTGPAWLVPGHPDDTVTLNLGYGRSRGGRLAAGAGFNAYPLRASDSPWGGTGAQVRRLEGARPLACTQNHHGMAGRHLVREATLQEFQSNPNFATEMAEDPAPDNTLYPPWDYSKGYAWGMAINLNSCIGCNACVVACQAENNVPVVGKDQVQRGREMHWLRIDRYYEGSLENPRTHFQPVLCMHCENAPCEVVCPVGATVHSGDGLNQMVYNRCVGTRYCSNNCPYKVRRFNFYQFADYETPSLKGLNNPDVTVRGRGIMEKCTYCVQRIASARIEAEKEDRVVKEGEVVTACQAACPTNAIVFGDINGQNSRVAEMKQSPLNYGILTELNTRPRTTYLAKVHNPNPALERT